METFIAVAIIVIVTLVVKAIAGEKEPWEKKLREIKQKNMEKNNKMQITTEGVSVEIGTRDLLMRVLIELGCQYTVDEDQRICFDYQGEHFWAEANNECKFINVYDAFWESCELFDVDGVARLKQAINAVNLNETVAVFYTINEADNTLWVHCKKNFLFIPHIPEVENYLKSMLADLFRAHHALGAEMERLKNNKK